MSYSIIVGISYRSKQNAFEQSGYATASFGGLDAYQHRSDAPDGPS